MKVKHEVAYMAYVESCMKLKGHDPRRISPEDMVMMFNAMSKEGLVSYQEFCLGMDFEVDGVTTQGSEGQDNSPVTEAQASGVGIPQVIQKTPDPKPDAEKMKNEAQAWWDRTRGAAGVVKGKVTKDENGAPVFETKEDLEAYESQVNCLLTQATLAAKTDPELVKVERKVKNA